MYAGDPADSRLKWRPRAKCPYSAPGPFSKVPTDMERASVRRLGSDQAQAELSHVLRGVAIDEFLQMRRHITQLQVTAMLDFARHILGDVFGPTFRGVEGNHLDRPAIFSGDQIVNDGFEVRRFKVGLAPGPA